MDLAEQAVNTSEHFRHYRESRDLVDDEHLNNALVAWEDFVAYHNLHNVGSNLASNDICKYWFILGYSAARISQPFHPEIIAKGIIQAKGMQAAIEALANKLKDHIDLTEREMAEITKAALEKPIG